MFAVFRKRLCSRFFAKGDVRGFSQKAADGPARSIRRCCCSYSLGIPLGSFSGATANRYAHRLNAVTDSSLYVIQ